MQNVIMIGCDLHDKNMLLKIAVNRDSSVRWSFLTSGRAPLGTPFHANRYLF